MSESPIQKKPRKNGPGCYNCSQRRINCDRGTPACQKCLKKGIQCWGLGVRYRFTNGVASRGKLAGKTVPVNTVDGDTIMGNGVLHSMSIPLDHVGGRERFLFRYFAENVSPAMVAIDSIANGYRDFILPLSDQDATVRNATMAAAASHLGQKYAEWKDLASQYHMAAIRGLNQRSQQANLTESIAYSNLSTMVLLLIEEMITGGRDFRILLRMVKCFVEFRGPASIEQTPQGRFLMQQIRKMSLYSQPLVSRESAMQALAAISREDLGFLYTILDSYPEHASVIHRLTSVIRKAPRIYLSCATSRPQCVIDALVRDFLAETSTFNAESPGGHILIWPFFIVGAECSSATDREFVTEQLRHLWKATGFTNTLYAIEVLERLWKKEPREWTRLMEDEVMVFIM
ncbi:hypothetical protein BDV25DRAFT_170516 [Aspergillus avenaceus]|uniref:Zn(2)-C6 fungal-type domain-containing protein n=1 Tax=Aspergillus avenaceus TaxID=36643 RepID=A0A5N6U1B2_ASPAV|nr:hypothetical protein BDV25DRAFT_170516 [Aspergillus avenaceus]